jgi:hypothetical protein
MYSITNHSRIIVARQQHHLLHNANITTIRLLVSSTSKNASSLAANNLMDHPTGDLHHANKSTVALTSSTSISTLPDFSDPASAHGTKSTTEIIRSIAVFQACRIPFLVKNAERLLDLSSKVLGNTITNTLMKYTFFRHFCAVSLALIGLIDIIDAVQGTPTYSLMCIIFMTLGRG